MTNTITLKRIWFMAGLLLILALSAGQMSVAHAANIAVNSTADNLTANDGNCTLREAIMNANSDSDTTAGDCVAGSGADVIDLPAGTYTIAIAGAGEDANATGDLDITDDLAINGAGQASSIIDGGGLDRVFHILETSAMMSGLTIRNGDGVSAGGGVLISTGVLSLNDSTVSGNSAVAGAGIYNVISDVALITTLNNTTVSGNTGSGNAGGIYNQFGTVALYNSTVTGNSGPGQGGIWNGSVQVLILKNSIVADNFGDFGGNDCGGGPVTSLGYNVDSDGSCITGAVAGDQPNANANLGPLQNNGGPTETHALLPGSDAINMGDPAGCTDGDGVLFTTDQRGFPRPNSGRCDIGAYEAQLGTIVIIKETSTGGGQDFGFTTTGGLDPETFDLDDDGEPTLSDKQIYNDVFPGAYTVTEALVPGHLLTALDCTDPSGGTTFDLSSRTASIDLAPGEEVTCTFNNTELGKIVIIKDSVPNRAQDFDYTTTGGLVPSVFSLDDDDDLTLSNTRTYVDLLPGNYSITETEQGAGYVLTDLTCDDPSGGTTTDLAAGSASINLALGEEVTCTFENTLSVGGTTSFLTNDSGSSAGSVALLAGVVATVIAIATAGGWYTRRRWMGHRS